MAGAHRTCEICGIQERRCSEKLFFARFPLEKDRCVEWLMLVGKEDLAYLPIEKLHDLHHVCGKHFAKKDFTKTKTRLKKRAVPKLHLTSGPQLTYDVIAEFLQLNSDVPSVSQLAEFELSVPAASVAIMQESAAIPSTSTANIAMEITYLETAPHATTLPTNQPGITEKQPVQLSGGVERKLDKNEIDGPTTPRERELMMQLKETKCALASLKQSTKLLENVTSTVLKDSLSALKNQKRKRQGKRWTTKNKISALAISKRSPKAYQYMQHMPLPSIKILQSILKRTPK